MIVIQQLFRREHHLHFECRYLRTTFSSDKHRISHPLLRPFNKEQYKLQCVWITRRVYLLTLYTRQALTERGKLTFSPETKRKVKHNKSNWLLKRVPVQCNTKHFAPIPANEDALFVFGRETSGRRRTSIDAFSRSWSKSQPKAFCTWLGYGAIQHLFVTTITIYE